MDTFRLRRTVALVASAALLATVVAATVAAPASAAKPKCFGKTATIVGTNKADLIIGTRKRDVIVAKGGADRIFGRGGNDLIDGGVGIDTCFQGLGNGPVVRCEKPAAPVTPVAPVAPPKILAIAYSDLDGNHQFGSGDVLISKLEDTNYDGGASQGDLITMSRYPTEFDASAFDDWGVSQHTVTSVQIATATELELTSTTGGVHRWVHAAQEEQYWEGKGLGSLDRSQIEDWHVAGHDDDINMVSTSPSLPGNHTRDVVNTTDDKFIDVDLFY